MRLPPRRQVGETLHFDVDTKPVVGMAMGCALTSERTPQEPVPADSNQVLVGMPVTLDTSHEENPCDIHVHTRSKETTWVQIEDE